MRLSAIFGAALAFAVGLTPALAADVFDIGGVSVDVTANNAAAARTQAMADGQRKAFDMMMRRLTLQKDWNRLPTASAQTLETVVRDFSVTEEKTSAVRYIATLAYRFKPNEIRALLDNYGIPYAETPSKPLLIVPVYQDGKTVSLWEEPNPWKAAWERRPQAVGLVPTVLPLGDLDDVSAISGDQAVAGDEDRLRTLAARYGAADTLVVVAALRPRDLQVTATRHGGAVSYPVKVAAFAAKPNESLDDRLARAANDLMQQVEDDWKSDNMVRLDTAGVMAAVVPLQGLNDWIAVKDRLSRVRNVSGMEGISLSRSEARLTLHYKGTPEQLTTALAQVDLKLTRDGDSWLLEPVRTVGTGR